jgi:hypothetical protein
MPMVTSNQAFPAKLATLAEARAVVGKERVIDDVGKLLLAGEIFG